MATILHSAAVQVPADVAWDFLDRYTRAEVHVFSACVREFQDGDDRVVVLADGTEIREHNITVDPQRRRAVYTVTESLGLQHHQAEMRVVDGDDRPAVLEWCTDLLPNDTAEMFREFYALMFQELLAAVNGHHLA
jgi:hypothetical protein